MINVKVICDSVSPQDKRLTTFKLRYPKFIHSELMTHRVLSRNASSSRAVPTAKLLAEVRSDAERATFVHWGGGRTRKVWGRLNNLKAMTFKLFSIYGEWARKVRLL